MNPNKRDRSLIATAKNIALAIVGYFVISVIVGAMRGILPGLLFTGISFVLTLGLVGFVVYEIFLGRTETKTDADKRRMDATRRTLKEVTKTVFSFETVHPDMPIINVTKPERGVLIIAGAGSGKSASVIEPIIVQSIQQNFGGLLYDFKFPSLATVAKYAADACKTSTKLYYIDLEDLSRSHRVNPLRPDLMRTQSYADEYGKCILNNLKPESIQKSDYWTDEASSYLTAVIWFLREEYPQYCTLPHVVSLVLEDTIKVVELLSTNAETRGTVASLRGAIERKAEAQVAGIDSTLKTALRKINTKEIAWVLSGNDFSLNLNDPEEPKFVTLGNYDGLRGVFGPVLALIATVALKQMNQPGKQNSVVILDEAPTIYIPGLEHIPATARSNKVATVFAAQDIAQIEDAYGRLKKDTLIANLSNQFWGRVGLVGTAQYVAELWGKHEVVQTTKSVSKSTAGATIFSQATYSKSSSESRQERQRIQINDVTELKEGEFFGQLVESEYSSFKAQLKAPQIGPLPQMLPFQDISSEQIRANFLQIQKDVQEILKNKTNSTKKIAQPDDF
ncbi:type IV secretory pathway VirD4 components-like protein (plasmid) [Fibrisoma limi BUZ 3]|uniref:Type IV secretory pathway VirD4 components-like protein n=1 Tax=Fibrisoma limi BUZ 3 TaxID=1185876 RepID=I2GU94_9BACT|nr:type IV secretory system conjugative DNA transfer family protein [Fibrisoma limi]CCH57695.1 type IV secretory pathway VirD4 components-like protein [Fibrisoma limi BUZ 3]